MDGNIVILRFEAGSCTEGARSGKMGEEYEALARGCGEGGEEDVRVLLSLIIAVAGYCRRQLPSPSPPRPSSYLPLTIHHLPYLFIRSDNFLVLVLIE